MMPAEAISMAGKSSPPLEAGAVFGRLTVVALVSTERMPREVRRIYRCQCACGVLLSVNGRYLKSGHSRSCGCLAREHRQRFIASEIEHGQTGTRLHQCWRRMLSRCYTPTATGYENYGGRGIGVCDDWRNGFVAFFHWATENGYRDDLTIDRLDVDKHYAPDNCRWIPMSENCRRTRACVYLDAFGERKMIADWLRDDRCCVPRHVLKYRLKRHWPVEAALTTPPEPWKGKSKCP